MEDVVRRSGLEAMLKKDKTGEETGESGLDNINALITSAAEYDAGNPEASLTEYLSMVSLVSDADHMKGSGGAITMMTLHAAKGLEFPVVAMIGLEEGVLPHSRSRGNSTELEEERRLCFVGITRAQEHLLLSKAAYRTIRGLRERTVPSPFLNEMPQDAVDVIDRTDLDFAGDRPSQRRLADIESESRAARFRKGQLVRHPMFGVGRISEIDEMGPQTRAEVIFNAAGRKTLILEQARLEPVS
jgi:DNA helicase-2/ATP-dependent DNA helicase PcrA